MLRDEGYNTKSDIFGLGSLLFNLITGRFLFNGKTADEVIRKNYECDLSYIYKYLSDKSIQLVDLIEGML